MASRTTDDEVDFLETIDAWETVKREDTVQLMLQLYAMSERFYHFDEPGSEEWELGMADMVERIADNFFPSDITPDVLDQLTQIEYPNIRQAAERFLEMA